MFVLPSCAHPRREPTTRSRTKPVPSRPTGAHVEPASWVTRGVGAPDVKATRARFETNQIGNPDGWSAPPFSEVARCFQDFPPSSETKRVLSATLVVVSG